MKENKSPAEYVMDMLIRKYPCFQRIDGSRQDRYRECQEVCIIDQTAPKHSPQKYNCINSTEYGQK